MSQKGFTCVIIVNLKRLLKPQVCFSYLKTKLAYVSMLLFLVYVAIFNVLLNCFLFQVADKLCSHIRKPSNQEPCNMDTCPYWHAGPWSSVSI